MKRLLKKILITLIGIYILICGLLYFLQEKLIFYPQKLDKNYPFEFGENAEELNIKSNDGKLLNGILFKAENSKGLIFYLHGNAGSLKSWGKVAMLYNNLNYDVFMLDYRSYGKSEGRINGQAQLFEDNQLVYNELKKKYDENKIIVLGYSIGTGLASKLASANHPKLLILQAPYYSLTDMMKQNFSFIPTFVLKYKFETNEYLKNCKMPVIIFHGNQDQVIYYGSSKKLEKEFKNGDRLVTLEGQDHNGMTENTDYQMEMMKILEN